MEYLFLFCNSCRSNGVKVLRYLVLPPAKMAATHSLLRLHAKQGEESVTNLVRRNLASGLTVGAANDGVLAAFLLLAGSKAESFEKTEAAISWRPCNEESFELHRKGIWVNNKLSKWKQKGEKTRVIRWHSGGSTFLDGAAICQSVSHMIQVIHVLDPSRNQGMHGQRAVQTCCQ